MKTYNINFCGKNIFSNVTDNLYLFKTLVNFFYVRKTAVKHTCAKTDSCHQLFCEKKIISINLQYD